MAQYRTGTVDVTNGDATVALAAGEAIANIPAGGWFIVLDESIDGAMLPYFVAATPTQDDEFELTAPWAGETAAGVVYTVVFDFTVGGIPILTGEEAGFAAIWNRTMQILAASGVGGSAATFQALLDTFAYSGHAGEVTVVNSSATALEPRDHRFITNVVTELAPTSVASRIAHYSSLLGTLNQSQGRATQWNDLSGNARHATAGANGPRVVGEAGRASYGLNFESSSDPGDDVLMVSTVPASQNTMFLYYVGRVDQRHAGSNNLWKTAHAADLGTQTAGDIELAAATSGNVLNLRISTSAGMGQLVALGPYKNGLPFILALNISSGSITGWVQGQGERSATAFSASYNHGTGFNTDRIRFGTSPDVVTAHVMHELLLSSAAQSATNLMRLVVWAQNQYFRSPLTQDEPAPLFFSSPDFGGTILRNWRRGIIATDGTNLTQVFGPAMALAVPGAVTVSDKWTGALLRSTSGSTFTATLLATVPTGWELDVEQEAGTAGNITLEFASGATNLNNFNATIAAGSDLRVRCVRNTNGASAEYVGISGAGVTGGGSAPGLITFAPGDNDFNLTDASLADVLITYDTTLTADHTVSITSSALPASGVGRMVMVVHQALGGFPVIVIDEGDETIVELEQGWGVLIAVPSSGAALAQYFPIEAGSLAALSTIASNHFVPEVISGQTAVTDTSNSDQILVLDATDGLIKRQTRGNFLAGITGGGGGSDLEFTADNTNYSGTPYQASSNPLNVWVRFTNTSGTNLINFAAGITEDSFGAFDVGPSAVAQIISAASVTINSLAGRGGANPAIAMRGYTTWIATADNVIELGTGGITEGSQKIYQPTEFLAPITLGAGGSISDAGPISASGTLVKATHGGRAVRTTGNVTIPNSAGDVGMGGIIIIGGAGHTIGFGAAVTAGLAVDDVVTYYVSSTTILLRSIQTWASRLAMS